MTTILSQKQLTKEEAKMKIKHLLLAGGLLLSNTYAQEINDTDLDGVPDSIDKCPNTPFLCEVDKTGCTTTILTLPFETEKESLNMTLGYGFSSNNDLKNREVQHNTKVKISYYLNSWGYTLQTGYYTHNLHDGALDTIIRVRKRIKINPKFVLSVGAGLRLPTYDFDGNKVDELLYSSLHYYPTSSLSFFGGYNFTRIGDDEVETVLPETLSGDKNSDGSTEKDGNEKEKYEGLQNTHKFYIGTGYFFTENFYMNIIFSDESNKFVSEHHIRAITSSLYYKINEKWFTTLYYKREVLDEDLHDNLLFTVGYTFW